MRVYISGKISGLTQDEYTHNFGIVEANLMGDNHDPVNPIKVVACEAEDCNNGSVKEDGLYLHHYTCYMKYDIIAMLSCDAIAMLPDWKDSKGAKHELAIAHLCGLKVYYIDAVTKRIMT